MPVFEAEARLYKFTDYLVGQVINIYQHKLLIDVTHCNRIETQIKSMKDTLINIHQFCQENTPYSNLMNPYRDLLKYIIADFQNEKLTVTRRTQTYQSTFLSILQSCKFSYLQDQKKILEYVDAQMMKFQISINQSQKNIQEMKEQIKQLQNKPFVKVMQILNDLDYPKIKQGFIFQESQQSKYFFKVKQDAILKIISDTQKIKDMFMKQIQDIRLIQQKRNILIEKAHVKIIKLNFDKIRKIQRFCLQLDSLYSHQNFKEILPSPIIQKVTFQDINISEFKTFYTSLAYSLIKTSQKKQLGRISKSISQEYKIKEQQNLVSLYHSECIDLSIFNQQYDSQINFIKCIKDNLNNADVQPLQMANFIKYFQKNIKKLQLKQTFLYFLYSDCQNKIYKQSTLLIQMMGIFLDQTKTKQGFTNGGHLAVKMIMLAYKIGFNNIDKLKKHKVWRDKQFWECSFLQSILQFLQIISDKDKSCLTKYYQIHNKQQQNHSWISSIFSSRIKSQQRLIQKKEKVLRKYYYEQILSLAHLYIFNMLALQIDEQKVASFKCLIQIAMGMLDDAPIQQTQELQDSFLKMERISKEISMKILKDKDIISNTLIAIIYSKDNQEILLTELIKKMILNIC